MYKKGMFFMFVFILAFCMAGCVTDDIVEKMTPSVSEPQKLGDYLYYLECRDYELQPEEDGDEEKKAEGGCSCVRNGKYLGRNLDMEYCDTPEFVVRIKKGEQRFESIGVCVNPDGGKDVEKMTKEQLLHLADITTDGMNENGVVVCANIVDAKGVDDSKGTGSKKEKVYAQHVVRYLLDYAESARDGVKKLKEMNIVGGFSGKALHWMIADAEHTYIVEIIDGKIKTKKDTYEYMTNFYLGLGEEQMLQTVAGRQYSGLPELNRYAIGVERWCILRDNYEQSKKQDGMLQLMRKVRATNTYEMGTEDRWYSEVSGNGLSIDEPVEKFEKKLAKKIEAYGNRDRNEPKGDRITWHTAIYDLEDMALDLYSQEEYDLKYCFSLKN